MNTLQKILSDLREKGARITKTREAVVGLFLSHHAPLSVPEIRDMMADNFPNLNKTTVYREIEFLRMQNIIHEIQFGDGSMRYEISSGPHHHHLVCMSCDSVEDIVLEKDLDEYKKSIEKTKNFKITDHSLEFFGLCAKCQ